MPPLTEHQEMPVLKEISRMPSLSPNLTESSWCSWGQPYVCEIKWGINREGMVVGTLCGKEVWSSSLWGHNIKQMSLVSTRGQWENLGILLWPWALDTVSCLLPPSNLEGFLPPGCQALLLPLSGFKQPLAPHAFASLIFKIVTVLSCRCLLLKHCEIYKYLKFEGKKLPNVYLICKLRNERLKEYEGWDFCLFFSFFFIFIFSKVY